MVNKIWLQETQKIKHHTVWPKQMLCKDKFKPICLLTNGLHNVTAYIPAAESPVKSVLTCQHATKLLWVFGIFWGKFPRNSDELTCFCSLCSLQKMSQFLSFIPLSCFLLSFCLSLCISTFPLECFCSVFSLFSWWRGGKAQEPV